MFGIFCQFYSFKQRMNDGFFMYDIFYTIMYDIFFSSADIIKLISINMPHLIDTFIMSPFVQSPFCIDFKIIHFSSQLTKKIFDSKLFVPFKGINDFSIIISLYKFSNYFSQFRINFNKILNFKQWITNAKWFWI